MPRKCNQAGIDLIQFYESLRLNSYLDIKGIPTIGWGHTGPEVKLGQTITKDIADATFKKDLERFELGVETYLTGSSITDNSFSALCSFSYNLGLGMLKTSTLLRLVNQGKLDQAANEFLKWDHAGGKQVSGLSARRRAEKELFLR